MGLNSHFTQRPTNQDRTSQMTLHKKTEKNNAQGKRSSNSTPNDAPGSLLAATLFRQALDRTDMPASAQKIGGFIVRLYNVEFGYAWPTVARIAFECSCSEATVYRAIEETGPLRQFFKVGKVIINGEERNTYTPDWDRAAAVNREFKIRLEEWKKAHPDATKAANDNRQDRNDVPHGAESGAGASQNERSRPRKMRGDYLSKGETIEVRSPNLRNRSYTIPERSAPGMSDHGSLRERACGAGRPRNEKQANQYRQTREEAERDWIELNHVLPGTSSDAEQQPGARSERGAKFLWNQLLRSGVPSSQILQSARGYLERKPAGQWQSGIAGFLASFDPEQLPDGTYPEDQRHGANDNGQFRSASGDDDLNRGVEVDV